MSKELDELLDKLLREIPETESSPEPPKPTKAAFQQAERIAKDVEQDKEAWRLPPEEPKVEIPEPPQHDPVIVPPPISHFTNIPSQNPAIRMRDRLEDTALPKPDLERKPTQIMDVHPKPDPAKRKKRKKKSGTSYEDVRRMIPDMDKPKPKVPHVPAEPAADIGSEAHQQEIRDRAERIREQLRKREYESLPPQPDTMTVTQEDSDMQESIRRQVNKAFAQDKTEQEKKKSEQPDLHHLSAPEQKEKRERKNSFFGRRKQKKEKKSEEDDTPTDWRTLVAPPKEGADIREIVNTMDEGSMDEEDDLYPVPPVETIPEKSPIPENTVLSPTPDPEAPPVPEPETPSMPEPEAPPIPDPETPPMPQSIGDAFREALDESAQELAEMRTEPLPEPGELVKTHFLRRHSYFLAGIICFLLALVGLVTCIRWGWQGVWHFAGSSSLRQQLEDVIYPAAVVDLPAFETPGELDAGSLMSAAMVDILMYDDLGIYEESFDVISIPAADVMTRTQQMFGTDFKTEYDTLHAAGETFYFDSTSGCYNVPVSPVIFSYSPEITDIHREDGICTVTVLYRSDMAKWQEHSDNFQRSGDKTMKVTLKENGDSYQITKIENVQSDEGE